MTDRPVLSRRAVLKTGAATALALTPAARSAASDSEPPVQAPAGETFTYEVTRSEDDWRARLSPQEFFVLREGGTEVPHTSLLAFETKPGTYYCRGCDLTIYDSDWKAQHPQIGWVFFSQSRENAVMMSVDLKSPYGRGTSEDPKNAVIEAHCRRCGSHFGHILNVKGKALHCINGTALKFTEGQA